MPNATLPPPILIADPGSLAVLVRALSETPAIAVDTESNSLFAYRERVCLIQFSTPENDYIVDPLRLPNLDPLAALFADPARQKIFHAAEYDIICLKRNYGFVFNEIFDTMTAARTLGWPQLGLGAILETRFDVKQNKKYQRANWGRRPLTPDQLNYARLDTHYLILLRDILLAELAAAERLAEAREEFARLTQVKGNGNGHGTDPQAFWHVTGARDLPPAQAGVLRELFRYREQQAQQADLPPFKILGDDRLIHMAQECPRHTDQLRPILSATQFQRYANGLMQAVRRGLEAPPLRPPHSVSEPDEVRERYDRLRQWRKQKAQARGVESDVIMPRDVLLELARRAPRTPEELNAVEMLGPWRRDTYGEEILKVLRGPET